jgi:glutaredoxin
MEIEKPAVHDFTIYSKSGCINCRKVKDLLKTKNKKWIIIDCDDYLLEDKQLFLTFIQKYSTIEWKTFPMVFHNEKFIGGIEETKDYLEKIIDFSDEF